MSSLRLFGVRSGVYLDPVHAGNTARLHAPHHPHSVDRALHKLGPSYPHQHPKPKECFIDPRLHLDRPRAHLFSPLRNLASPSCMPPAPFASAYSTSPSTVHRPRPKEAASIPALTSTSTADDRISSHPLRNPGLPRSRAAPARRRRPPVHAARSLEPAPTSQSIASRRAAQPYLDSRAIPMRFPTMHTVFGEVHPPRAAARRTADTTYPSVHPSGPESRIPSGRAIFVRLEEGTPRALAERLPIPLPRQLRVCLDLRRSRTLSRAGLSVELCRARGARLLQLVAGYCRRRCVLACVRARDVDASLPIARHPPSSIFTLLLPPNVARTTRERLLPLFFFIGAAGGLFPPQVAAEKIFRHGAERSNRWPQVPKQLSVGLDYTNRPTVFSRLSVRLIYTAQGTGAHLHPVLPAGLFATHLNSSRRALPHLDYAMMRFRGDAGSRRRACAAAGPAGSGSFWGLLPPCKYSYGVFTRPSDLSIPHLDRTAWCSRRCVRAAARRRAHGGPGLRDAASGGTEYAGFNKVRDS
ncbi:hypothetical protein B0H14DRAFT_3867369 [Mycena olivaceomarginata]|nr:hypothetical protein B0H14DRAFT_3867369 [Mycena olivaceomarginata]